MISIRLMTPWKHNIFSKIDSNKIRLSVAKTIVIEIDHTNNLIILMEDIWACLLFAQLNHHIVLPDFVRFGQMDMSHGGK